MRYCILNEFHREQIGGTTKWRQEPAQAGAPGDRENERGAQRAVPQILDTDEAQHRDDDGNHGRGHNDTWQHGGQQRAHDEPGDHLSSGARSHRRQRHERNAAVEATPGPDGCQDVGADEQDDQLVGVRGKHIRDRDEADQRHHGQRQQPGHGQVHRTCQPPRPHPQQQPETAADGIGRTGGRQKRRSTEHQRPGKEAQKGVDALRLWARWLCHGGDHCQDPDERSAASARRQLDRSRPAPVFTRAYRSRQRTPAAVVPAGRGRGRVK